MDEFVGVEVAASVAVRGCAICQTESTGSPEGRKKCSVLYRLTPTRALFVCVSFWLSAPLLSLTLCFPSEKRYFES